MIDILNNLGTELRAISMLGYVTLLLGAVFVGLIFLTKGGDLLCDYSSILAEKLGIPSVIIGLTIVSIATSAPELFTSISAINSNAGGLVIGNITGSNVANIGLILGIVLLIKPISTFGAVKSFQLVVLAVVTIGFSLSFILNDNYKLGSKTGIVLIIFIICYLGGLCFYAMNNRDTNFTSNNPKEQAISLQFVSLMIMFGGAMLWLGSESLVFGSKNLAMLASIPDELIGFTLVAIGTSLPELAASISLVKKEETNMLLGNILGSNLFNIGLVGGVAGILGPISCKAPYPWFDHASMLFFTGLLVIWMTGKKLGRKHGILLLSSYIAVATTSWIVNS